MAKSVFTDRYRVLRRLLIEARSTAGLSQATVAERLRRPQTFVSKTERGERRLDVVEFLELAEVLGVDPQDVLEKLRSTQQRTKKGGRS